MIKKGSFLLRILVFLMIFALLIIEINYIFLPKKYIDDEWPTTATYKGFYQMKKDSVDVLFLGSSHAASAFNPQTVYDYAGIGSYNLGCEQQNTLVSYYWLKEAIKYQSPKVIILDVYMLFSEDIDEACTRMAMDAMRWSRVKYEAVRAICNNDERQDFKSYVFTNIRFHTRWKDLVEQDFAFRSLEEHYELKGFTPLNTRAGKEFGDFQPLDDCDSSVFAEPVPLMSEYLDKIKELCDENGIELILVKTPTTMWDAAKHNYVAQYSDEKEIDFVDFNTREVYNSCDFDFSEDMFDYGHSNLWGAEKISSFLAAMLKNQYGIDSGTYSEQWANTDEYYKKIKADCGLKNITDLEEFITAIDQDRYTILISVRNDMTFCMNDDIKKAFSQLGLDLDSEKNDSYYAAITDCDTVQKSSSEMLNYTGSTRGKLQVFNIVSGGSNGGAQSSIRLGDEEYSKNMNGINIVVYSEETRKVVDSVVYDGTLHR